MGDMADMQLENADWFEDNWGPDDSVTNIEEEREYLQTAHQGTTACQGTVTLRMNRKTRQLFWGCNRYPLCKWSASRVG